jgi:hypothetical protein
MIVRVSVVLIVQSEVISGFWDLQTSLTVERSQLSMHAASCHSVPLLPLTTRSPALCRCLACRHRLLQQALSSPAAINNPSNVRAAGSPLLYPGRSAAAPHSVSLAATAGANQPGAGLAPGDAAARPASASPGQNYHSSGNGSCKNGMHGSFTGGMVRWGASCSAAGSFTGTAAAGGVARSGGSFCGSLGSVASGEVRACPGYQALLRNMPVKQYHSCNGGRPIQLQSGRTSPAGQE